MHKRIALLIDKMIKESPYATLPKPLFKCKVIPNKNSDGFWRCKITFKRRGDSATESVVQSLLYIGRVYGEGLAVQDNGKVVEVS